MRIFLYFIIILVAASVASLPRFGQRENEYASAVSDSDFYIDMARVFAGRQAAFNPDYTTNQAHHYNRPLLPWLAGNTARYFLKDNWRIAFSLINSLAAALTAWIFSLSIMTFKPGWKLHWLPGLLFLFGFPQLNWGYHILTDTLGIATAFACTIYSDWIIRNRQPNQLLTPHLAGILLLSSATFLARETGWLAVVAVSCILFNHLHNKPRAIVSATVLTVVLLGKIPHSIYAQYYGFNIPSLLVTSPWSWNPMYWLDVIIKAGICFNIAWLLLIWSFLIGLKNRNLVAPPTWMTGWTIGSLLYMGAVYVANDINLIGYPTRVIYSIFPIVFFWLQSLFENMHAKYRPRLLAMLLAILQLSIALLGVYLDPGTPKITAQTLIGQ